MMVMVEHMRDLVKEPSGLTMAPTVIRRVPVPAPPTAVDRDRLYYRDHRRSGGPTAVHNWLGGLVRV